MSTSRLWNSLRICKRQKAILSFYHPLLNSTSQRWLPLVCHYYHQKTSATDDNVLDSPNTHQKTNSRENYVYFKKFVQNVVEKEKDSKPEISKDSRQQLVPGASLDSTRDQLASDCVNNKPSFSHSPDLMSSTAAVTSKTGLNSILTRQKFVDKLNESGLILETNDQNKKTRNTLVKSNEVSDIYLKNKDLTKATVEGDVKISSAEDTDGAANVRTTAVDIPRFVRIEPSYNLVPYVNQSHTLQQFVKLGVDLATVEKVQGAADLIIKLDFETGIKPYLKFLAYIGVEDDKLAECITKNPLIFQVDLDSLHSKINYFQSKKFSSADIARIATSAPRFLLMSTTAIDGKLGLYQKLFKLTGSQVREVIARLPKLITYDIKAIKDIHFQMKEFLGFTDSNLQKMFLLAPKIFLCNKYKLTDTFEYLYSEMALDHAQLVQWPHIFRTRLFKIKERHLFLKNLKRNQYDSSKENYVSLQALVSSNDKVFGVEIAKSSVAEFNQFLKTL